MNAAVTTLTLKLLMGCYGYMLVMSGMNVLSCELRSSGQCGDQWTQAFTVAGGATSTLWAFITESPSHSAPTKTPNSERGREKGLFS